MNRKRTLKCDIMWFLSPLLQQGERDTTINVFDGKIFLWLESMINKIIYCEPKWKVMLLD